MTAVLDVTGASVRFGVVEVLSGVSLALPGGAVVGLVGPNGAGKTTLLDAISGLVPLAAGSVRLGGVDITALAPHRRARLGLARTFQGLELFEDLSVAENLAVASDPHGVLVALSHSRRGSARQERTGELSHAERKAVALDRALAGGARVLLLDEPAAGLDEAGRQALAGRLRALAGDGVAVVLADHDLDLVMDVSDEVCVLDFGRVIAHGPPAQVRADPVVLAAYLGGPTTLYSAKQVPQRANRASQTEMEVAVEARGLVAGYGTGPAVDGLDLVVRAGEVVALLGPNGAGKTTTLRALSGLVPVWAGDVTVLGARAGPPPERLARRGLAHVPQDRAVLASLTVAENLRLASRPRPAWPERRRDHGRDRARGVDAALARFGALVPLLGRRAGRLSGGEQQLLALARAVAAEPRVVLVDELSLGLAPRAARQAIEAVRGLADAGAGCVLAEQHPVLALEVADRAVVLVGGRCVFTGAAADLAARPELLQAAYLGKAQPPNSEGGR